jgi:flagellar motor switch protein FliM
MIDVLLGGRRGQTSLRIEGRPYTTIETNLVKRLVEVVLADAEQAFRPLSPVTFTIDRLETNPRFAAISRPANAAILVRLHIDMEDRGGNIELLLPYATIEPIRPVRCGNVTLTEGRMGRVGDRVAIRVTKQLRRPNTTLAMFEKADEQNKALEAQ